MKKIRFFLAVLFVFMITFQLQAQSKKGSKLILLTEEVFPGFQNEKVVNERFRNSGGVWTITVQNSSRVRDLTITTPDFEKEIKPSAQRQLLAYKANDGAAKITTGMKSTTLRVVYYHQTVNIKNKGKVVPGNTYRAIFAFFRVSFTDDLGEKQSMVLTLPIMKDSVATSAATSAATESTITSKDLMGLSVFITDKNLGLRSDLISISSELNFDVEIKSEKENFLFVIYGKKELSLPGPEESKQYGIPPRDGIVQCNLRIRVGGRWSYITNRQMVEVSFVNGKAIISNEDIFGMIGSLDLSNVTDREKDTKLVYFCNKEKGGLPVTMLSVIKEGDDGIIVSPSKMVGAFNKPNLVLLEPGSYSVLYYYGSNDFKLRYASIKIPNDRSKRVFVIFDKNREVVLSSKKP